MAAPVIVEVGKNIVKYLPVKIDNMVRCETEGITVNSSYIIAELITDRYNPKNMVSVKATINLDYDTTGKSSALPDQRYQTLFNLNVKGLCPDEQYVFIDNITGNVFGPQTGSVYGDVSNKIFLSINANSSNAKGKALINIEYLVENVNFGYGVLFPEN